MYEGVCVRRRVREGMCVREGVCLCWRVCVCVGGCVYDKQSIFL